MTVFGPAWADLELEHVEAFLEQDAEDEPLLWEAKGTKLDRHEIRKQVCGFANSHEGGYLILGAKRQGERWALDPLEFPEEPAPWINKLIRDGGVRPIPDIDTRPFPAGNGRHVAVVRVDRVASPPCNARGTVYERVSGETIPVRDPQRLADLFARGDQAHRVAEMTAFEAAKSAFYEAGKDSTYEETHVQFAVGLSCIGRANDIGARLFTSVLEERATAGARDLVASGPFSPMVDPQWGQTRLVARSQSGGFADRAAIVMAKWDGSVAVYDRIATEYTVVESLVDHRVSLAWEIARDLQGLLGGFGDSYLALLVMPAPIRAQATDSSSGQWVRVTRGPTGIDPTRAQLASIRRELERAAGARTYEPDTDE